MGSRGRILCVSLLALALAVLGGRPAQAAEKAIWGPTTLPGGGSAFPTYRHLGVDTLQLYLEWGTVAPSRPRDTSNPADPAYRWPADLDRSISEAASNGMRIALVVRGSPAWANGGRSPIDVPSAAEFATFVATASRRYPYVRRWMIWGEPNRDDRFQPNAPDSPIGPRAYAPILDAAYGALKGVSPANIVIGGMTWTGGTVKPAPFLRYMRLPNGRPPRLDWFGHNPFPFRFPDLREEYIPGGWRDMSDMDLFSEELRRVYGPRVRLWLAEFQVLSDKPSREFESFVPLQAQGDWLTAAYRIADNLPSIAGMGWLGLLDEPERPGSSNSGLLTASGARKPAFEAFRRAPSVRFRPSVRVSGRAARRALSTRGLNAMVRPRIGGRISAELVTSRGRRLLRTTRHVRRGKLGRLRLRGRAPRGRFTVVVRGPRAESVRRAIRVK